MQTTNEDTLVDRALTAKTLYNVLAKVVPENDEGNQQAFIGFDGNTLDVVVPPKDMPMGGMYGMDISTIAKLDQPFQLIPKISPQDPLTYAINNRYRDLLRQSLRKIVDEA